MNLFIWIIRISIFGILCALSIFDIRKKEIPLIGMAPIGIMAIGQNIASIVLGKPVSNVIISALLGCIPGMFIIIMAITSKKVGIGDGILLIELGIMEGYIKLLVLLFLSTMFLSALSVVLILIKKIDKKKEMPYVPFISGGYLLVVASELICL